jgi:hypothetical protein
MEFQATGRVDKRDAGKSYEHLEASIEKLKQRIVELEIENGILRSGLRSESGTISHLFKTRPNSY